MNKKLLAVLLLLAGFRVGAQVEFVEPNSLVIPKDPSKQWEHMDIYRSYDSSNIVVPVWPTIEAYKKYIGQTFFLLGQKHSRSSYFLSNMGPKSKILTSKDVILLGSPMKKDKYPPYKRGRLEAIMNKYYTIVNVVNYLDESGMPRKSFSNMKQLDYRTYTYPCKDDKERECSSSAEVPCFVLVEQSSGDTCYTVFPEKFIIVGAYVKLQQLFEGVRLNYVLRETGKKNSNEPWRIVKVAIVTRDFYNYPDYEGLPTIAYIIENEKHIQKAIPVKEYANMKWWSLDDPQLVNDALSRKRVAEEEQQCCTDLVKELDKKFAGTKEMQEMGIVLQEEPITVIELGKPSNEESKKVKTQKTKIRRNI